MTPAALLPAPVPPPSVCRLETGPRQYQLLGCARAAAAIAEIILRSRSPEREPPGDRSAATAGLCASATISSVGAVAELVISLFAWLTVVDRRRFAFRDQQSGEVLGEEVDKISEKGDRLVASVASLTVSQPCPAPAGS